MRSGEVHERSIVVTRIEPERRTLRRSPQPDFAAKAREIAGMCSLVLGVNVRHFFIALGRRLPLSLFVG